MRLWPGESKKMHEQMASDEQGEHQSGDGVEFPCHFPYPSIVRLNTDI
jgi:hypothetical protein